VSWRDLRMLVTGVRDAPTSAGRAKPTNSVRQPT
jgi:hypothetical protein